MPRPCGGFGWRLTKAMLRPKVAWGFAYGTGRGVEQDFATSYMWLTLADRDPSPAPHDTGR